MNHMQRREQLRGIALTIIGGIFWGLAGVCGQYLFEERGLTAKWLVSVRLVLAGLILLLTVWAKQKKQMFEIWREKRDVFQLIMFGIFGMAFCQLSYYVAVETSNAGTATVLQYTAPIIIMLYVSVRNKKVPQRIEMLALVLAVGVDGLFMETHEDPSKAKSDGANINYNKNQITELFGGRDEYVVANTGIKYPLIGLTDLQNLDCCRRKHHY